ncbi:hypothetical protein G7Y31_04445 [Corynebacterium lizhenjunii]|uniref:Uncharacterized protein n=1 Tax=Corynebacterium lizhenjunii TaxID=2709394 RepID=A0A7T0PCP7_9CORY|nr:hypothetical protein [Corynebacterium lizhenjunii]QPK79947.1 hypothetical protein G7Y31_04445 [Corynebacterium lizhenjunii]
MSMASRISRSQASGRPQDSGRSQSPGRHGDPPRPALAGIAGQWDAAGLRAHIARTQRPTLQSAESILTHPRSLARPVPDWRPPTLRLPAVGEFPSLNLALTRYRVGPRVKARLRGYGEPRVPAFLVVARLSDPQGRTTDGRLTHAWVSCLVQPESSHVVHEITSSSSATFVWLVDRDYTPVASPLSLFEDFSAAA